MAFRGLKLLVALQGVLCLTLVHALTFPSDLVGNFTAFNDANPVDCPPFVAQTTYSAGPIEYSWELPHNTIYNGLEQCDSVGSERKLVYYNSSLIPSGVPEEVSAMLEKHGWNIEVNYPLYRRYVTAGETYYVGYEEEARFCQEKSNLNAGTMVFVFRPWFPVYMPIDQTKYLFEPEYKYMIITPTFEEYVCMYRATIDGSPGAAAPTPTESTSEPLEDDFAAPAVHQNTTAEEPDTVPAVPVVAPSKFGEEFTEFGDSEASMEPMEAEKASCFPADSQVQLQDGSYLLMKDLEIGDVVRTGDEKYSQVYSFTHKVQTGMNAFVEIKTANSQKITLSRGHYLYINQKLVAAKNAVVGDTLHTSQGIDKIVSVKEILAEGLYNPQTIDGNIVVDNVLASTYTTAIKVIPFYLL